jgi:hypothetical protein
MWNRKKTFLIGGLLCFLLIYIYTFLPSVLSWGPGTNYRNVSVKTTVNVTQAYPEILNVTCNNGTALTLNPGSYVTITCIVSIRDFNGGTEINNTNGTFYYYLNQSTDPNDNNVHYANSSCAGGTANGNDVNWTCSFSIFYYANNGSWRMNATVIDKYNMTTSSYTNVTISQLYALNVTNLIDFGNMAVGDTTITSVQANITNFGNMNINVSVYGFGGDNETTGAGYAMLCQQRNLTLPNERFGLNVSTNYDSMTAVTNTYSPISGLTVLQQTDDAQQVINSTYWRIHINISSNPFGICNGTVVFSAEVP